MKYYSQANQDKWVCTVLNNKTNGYFIDLGAHDGIGCSNTYILEKNYNWNGVCVEAKKESYNSLVRHRTCKCIHGAVSNKNGICKFSDSKEKIDSDGTEVPEYTLDTILTLVNSPKEIDYLSIDIEGHELAVFEAFNFSNWDIKLMTVEHNLYLNGPDMKYKLFNILSNNGFVRVVNDAICLDKHPSVYGKPFEDWYVSSNHISSLEKYINTWNSEGL
jgi:FkbM family methyltransferase